MKQINYNEYFEKATSSLNKGAFLTVKNQDKLNTMTIGWATIGRIWGKPVLMVMVRKSRYTHTLIEKVDNFTVSFAFDNKMKEELTFCGTKSGRDFDKFQKCNLETISARNVDTPFIKGCDLHYECNIKYKQNMNQENLIEEFQKKHYSSGDYHTLYFGEILGTYLE
ncbi:MAG: flavin reductase family protein [bacterium]